jgi:hypothetical protein
MSITNSEGQWLTQVMDTINDLTSCNASKSSSLGEHVEPELSDSNAASHPGVARPKMDPLRPPLRDTAAEIEATVRLLLRELQLRRHHNERNTSRKTVTYKTERHAISIQVHQGIVE